MFDLEWRLAVLSNLVDPLATLGCRRFLLLLKASRISRNIQAESRKFLSYKKRVFIGTLLTESKLTYTSIKIIAGKFRFDRVLLPYHVSWNPKPRNYPCSRISILL